MTTQTTAAGRERKIIEVNCDEDGETYVVVGDITKLGAVRALKKQLREWGIEEDVGQLPEPYQGNFWRTNGGSYDGCVWWKMPDKSKDDYEKIEPLGIGWIFDLL